MVSCEQHDYFEIACMFRYPLRVTLQTGQVIEGEARDVVLDEQRRECLVIGRDDTLQQLPLTTIGVVEVLCDNPHFRRLTLNT